MDQAGMKRAEKLLLWRAEPGWAGMTEIIQKVTENYNKVTKLYNFVTELENSTRNVLCLLLSEVAYIGTGHILP